MESLVKRFGWTVGVGLVGLIGLVHAKTVANVLSTRLLAPASRGTITVPESPKASALAGRRSEFIDARNIFDSTAHGPPPAEDEAAGEDVPELDPTAVPESDLSMTLAGAIYSPDPRWSLAVINDGQTSRIAQVGNKLKPDVELVAIWSEEAWVRREDGRIERLRSGDAAAGRKAGSLGPTTSYQPETGSVDPGAAGLGVTTGADAEKFKEGITRTDSDNYKITKGLIEEQLQDLNKLGTQARIIPHYKDGQANGFKLVGIRPGSLYSHIGIRSGDVIRGVNGTEINSPTKALQAFEQFKNASEVDLEIIRRGQNKVLHYKITP